MNNSATRRHDNGFWQALPVAALDWVLALWGVGYFLTRPVAPEPQPQVVEERLVELPPEVQTPAARPQTPPPKALPLPQPVPQPQLAEPVPAPPPPQAESHPQPPAPPPPPPPVAAAPAARPVAGVETHGPIALSNPDPVLPDELLDQVAGSVITVHVTIGIDGSLGVDIANKAVDPRVRRSIIDQLKKTWHFAPAVDAGRAVVVSQDFNLKF